MARRSWFESGETTEESPFAGSVQRLESWRRAMEDGVIEPHEVADQKERLVGMLRELEPMLDDRLHEKVTRLLEEWVVLQAMHATLLVEEFGNGAAGHRLPSDDEPPGK